MKKKNDRKIFDALSFAWDLGFFIIIPVGGLLFLGILADSFFDTKPLLAIAGLIAGICVSGYGTYRFVKPFLQDDVHDDDEKK